MFINLRIVHLLNLILLINTEKFTNTEVKTFIELNGKKYNLKGKVVETDDGSVDYYGKIPYAKPPIGDLRFKHPVELTDDPWPLNETYKADVQPQTCWQAEPAGFDTKNLGTKLWYSETKLSEDCLYLTIWSPKVTSDNLAVMVWIYGGAFLSGSSTLKVYDGFVLASKEKVIVVTLQYRVGPLGFMYLDKDEAPGNQGLLDQALAIKWVKQHIKQFRGDPNKITIFGESAGSASVSLQVLSPLSHGKGYFQRAILESGSSLSSWSLETKEQSLDKGKQLGIYVNCNETGLALIKCMRNVDPKLLINKQFLLKSYISKQRYDLFQNRLKNIKTDASKIVDVFFIPIYDDYFLPGNRDDLFNNFYQRTKNNKFDLIAGFNRNEGMFFILYSLNPWLNFLGPNGIVHLNDKLSSSYMKISPSDFVMENCLTRNISLESLRNLIIHEYNVPSFDNHWNQWTSVDALKTLDQIVGNLNFICPTIDYGHLLILNQTSNVYYYNFIHKTSNSTFPKWTGTMHGYEIEYVFGMPFSNAFQNSYYRFNDEERKLSAAVMKLWSNFAKTGNPTSTKVELFNQPIIWESHSRGDERILFLETPNDQREQSNKEYFRGSTQFRKCRFWSQALPPILEAMPASNIAFSIRYSITIFAIMILVIMELVLE